MGFPEIVDYARNFSVMVKIQGPDPKGLKMRKHAFHHYSSGKTTLSASGMLFPGFSGNVSTAKQIGGEENEPSLPASLMVFTVASVIEPFLSQPHRENILKDKPQLIHGVQIKVLVEEVNVDGYKGESSWLPAELLMIVDIPMSSNALQSLIEASPGTLDHGWEVGWSLASFASDTQSLPDTALSQVEQSPFQNSGEKMDLDSSNLNILSKLTTRIALLRVASEQFQDLPELNTFPQSRKGDLLLAMGSPFGILSPVHFLNSISVGSVANSYPPCSSSKSLLMADIRCLPGMEGSPVFGEHAQLIGMLIRPLRQRDTGAEVQLVIPWETITSTCHELLQKEEPLARWKETFYNNENLNTVRKSLTDGTHVDNPINHIPGSGFLGPSPVEKAMASICLITIDDGAWASGVLLNKQGLVLTNAHLLEPWRFGKAAAAGDIDKIKVKSAYVPFNELIVQGYESSSGYRTSQYFLPTGQKHMDFPADDGHNASRFNSMKQLDRRSIRVRLDCTDPWLWTDARVIYVSKGPLDVALLQLELVPDQLLPISLELTCPSLGSKAYVIGHGLFGPRCDFLPSACCGVISKVVQANFEFHYESSVQQRKFPAMLETTAAVHPGGSGGAVVDLDGHMVGLVTSNARHGGGTVIPHLNFSIPCAALEPIFKFSEDMQALEVLEDLDRPNEHLSAIWALMQPLNPKPGPSLPSVPRFQVGDGDKDGKGSRFAKFISERGDLFQGKAENLGNKLIQSKL